VVVPLVAIMRSAGSHVFLDTDSIAPGKRWEDVIGTAIETCDQVMVFWCAHASQSDEVRKEYTYGLERKREICPVLLDDTGLSEPLQPFQWIDFRDVVRPHVEVRKLTMTAEEVRRAQQAHRLGKEPWDLGPGEADHLDHTRAHYSDARLFREGWRVVPGGGAVRESEYIHEPSKDQLQVLATRVMDCIDRR
jgi:hypothetical protein